MFTLEVITETGTPWAILMRSLPNLVVEGEGAVQSVGPNLPAGNTETFNFPPVERAAFTWYGDSECKVRWI